MSLEFSQHLGLWVIGTLAAIVALGIDCIMVDRAHWRRRGVALCRCEQCGRVYEDERNVPLSACPACGTLNEAIQK